jgi:hypothetical protein
MSAVELTPILTIAYGNKCQGTKKGIYFGITKGIAYTVDFAIGFAMDVP